MINANELRVGNIIRFTDFPANHAIKVTPQIIKQISEGGVSASFFSAIPIAPELLEKCGFIFNNIYKLWEPVNNKTYFPIVYYQLLEECRLNILEKPFGRAFKYLHQLQNLYFALTGEELPINL